MNNKPIAVKCSFSYTEDFTKKTWAHAVNSEALLDEALQSDIDFIEADIVMGYLDNNSHYLIPVMAHPPQTVSDISLHTFLKRILNYNSEGNKKVKGVKLDFKSIEAFENSIQVINSSYDMEKFPTWINADILSGPVNNTETIPVDPTRFFEANKNLHAAVLSIGWTTKWGIDYVDGAYDPKHIITMLDTIRSNGIDKTKNTITFPVRAGIAANSIDELTRLYNTVKETNGVTFTIWSSKDDNVNVPKLREFIFKFGQTQVYLDVPEDLAKQLHLDDKTSQ